MPPESPRLTKPWREVVHIEYSQGERGGQYWWLTLECGHHKSVPIPPLRIEFGLIVSFGNRSRAPKKRTAPERCRCLLCALAKDRESQRVEQSGS